MRRVIFNEVRILKERLMEWVESDKELKGG